MFYDELEVLEVNREDSPDSLNIEDLESICPAHASEVKSTYEMNNFTIVTYFSCACSSTVDNLTGDREYHESYHDAKGHAITNQV